MCCLSIFTKWYRVFCLNEWQYNRSCSLVLLLWSRTIALPFKVTHSLSDRVFNCNKKIINLRIPNLFPRRTSPAFLPASAAVSSSLSVFSSLTSRWWRQRGSSGCTSSRTCQGSRIQRYPREGTPIGTQVQIIIPGYFMFWNSWRMDQNCKYPVT